MSARYEARPTNPPAVWDSLLNKKSSEHLTYESAVARAYCLNRFSTGARI